MNFKVSIASIFLSLFSLAAEVCIVTPASIGTSVECNGKSQLSNGSVTLILANLLNSGYVIVGQSPTTTGTTYTLVKR